MKERCPSMYLTRLKNFAPACVVAALVAGSPVSVAAASTGPFAPLTRASASSAYTAVNETGELEKESSSGTTIEEKGIGKGSFHCSVVMEMTLSGTLVTAKYTAWLSGGSISGTATAHIYEATKKIGYFKGTITLHGGTRARTHASGTAKFFGEINREYFNMKTHITGNLRLQ
jgi:hypothetical protein